MTNTNKARARRALKALNAYRKLMGLRRTTGGPNMDESVIDIVTDLRHLSNQKGLDFKAVERNSESHFMAEVHGEEE
jgi:hypothetical protein